jgi:hypothetical protein
MTEVLHHDTELADFLRIGTGRKVLGRVCVREGNYMKSHLEPPEMFDDRQASKNYPRYIKQNNSR